MGYAFISYSTKNQSSADAFRQLLKKYGVETWMAPYDIPAGSEYAEVLYDALTGCACLILLLTADSQSSLWVKKEVNIAVSNCRPLIPVKLENIELNSAMKLYLNDQQIVPVRTLDESNEDVQKVLRSVIAIAGQKKPPQAATAAAATKPAGDLKQVFTDSFMPPAGNTERKEYNNGVYEGQLVNGKRHGKGKFTWTGGDVYEGDWVDDQRIGKGRYTWPSGDVYEGDFVDGKITGKGKKTWANGDVYEGDWVNDQRTGKGRYTWPSGDVYEGDFVDDKRTGKGRYTFPSGNVYEGDYVDGKRTGKGTFSWADGEMYEGDFVDGKRTGKGKYTWANGDVYEGDFVDGKRTGWGKYTYANGTVKQGRFENGAFQG